MSLLRFLLIVALLSMLGGIFCAIVGLLVGCGIGGIINHRQIAEAAEIGAAIGGAVGLAGGAVLGFLLGAVDQVLHVFRGARKKPDANLPGTKPDETLKPARSVTPGETVLQS
jgi:hypothetical protein